MLGSSVRETGGVGAYLFFSRLCVFWWVHLVVTIQEATRIISIGECFVLFCLIAKVSSTPFIHLSERAVRGCIGYIPISPPDPMYRCP